MAVAWDNRRGGGGQSPSQPRLDRERRALLGAALGLPLVGDAILSRHPDGRSTALLPAQDDGAASGEEWHAALGAFRAAAAAVGQEERRLSGASFEDAEAGQGGYDRLCEKVEAALAHLLAAAAPDVAALATKLILFAAHEGSSLPGAEDALAIMTADALRLSAQAAAHPAPRAA